MNPDQPFAASVVELFSRQWRHRQLSAPLTKREVAGRYRGSLMGLAWSFLNPILMLLSVYSFAFSEVFKARWGAGESGGKASFAVLVWVGKIVHGLFAECINRAPGLILANVNYVKKVLFPLAILPSVAMGSALFHAIVNLIARFGAPLLSTGEFPNDNTLAGNTVSLWFASVGCARLLSSPVDLEKL